MGKFEAIMAIVMMGLSSSVLSNNSIYVYVGPGSSVAYRGQAVASIKRALGASYEVKKLTSKTLKQGRWIQDAALLVMPGGADRPYDRLLRGQGNKLISDFVHNGGSYLGLCAGGYYGGKQVRFDAGGSQEVVEDRELGFFPGTVQGPTLAPYDPRSSSGTRAALLNTHLAGGDFRVLYNGGGHFVDAETMEGVEVLAKYGDAPGKSLAAIVYKKIGSGRAVLSGVHFEFDANDIPTRDPFLRALKPVLLQSNKKRLELLNNILALLLRPAE